VNHRYRKFLFFVILYLSHLISATSEIKPKNLALGTAYMVAGAAYSAYALKLAVQYWADHNYNSHAYELLKKTIPIRMRQFLIVSSLGYVGYKSFASGLIYLQNKN
jgi:hypothetical protein